MNEREQFEFCKILDDWYIEVKPQFKGIHPLGQRKEDLKGLVCKWIETKQFSPDCYICHGKDLSDTNLKCPKCGNNAECEGYT